MKSASGNEQNLYANAIVVLVPGLFSPRVTMCPMARRFKQHGFQTLVFPNRYLLKTPEQNAHGLLAKLQALSADRIHLLGHSLGGVVIMHALRLNSEQPVGDRFADGKVVLIASPVNGSEFARAFHGNRVVKKFLGRCLEGGVLNGMPEQLDGRETGVISGSSRAGLAAMIYHSEHPNDGMINEFETQLSGAQDAVSVPQSHALMLFSRRCSELAIRFVQYGQFKPIKHQQKR